MHKQANANPDPNANPVEVALVDNNNDNAPGNDDPGNNDNDNSTTSSLSDLRGPQKKRRPYNPAPPGVQLHQGGTSSGSRRPTTSSAAKARPDIANSNSNYRPRTPVDSGSATKPPTTTSRFSASSGSETIIKADGESFQSDEDGAVARSFDTGGTSIMGVQISPDKKYLGANSLDGTVYVFDLKQGGKLLYKIASEEKLIRAIAFSDTSSLYTITDQETLEENCIAIRRAEDGSRTEVSIGDRGRKRASDLAVSTDGRSIFANWTDSASTSYPDSKFWRFSAMGDEVKVFDLESNFRDTETYRPRLPSCSKFTPDGSMLVSGFVDGWIAASSSRAGTLEVSQSKLLHAGRVLDVDISADGKNMVSGDESGAIQLTNLKSSSWSSKLLNREHQSHDVLGVAFSSDGNLIAASLANRTVEIYDVPSRKLVNTLQVPSICSDLEFMSGDQFVVAGGKDGKIRILKVE